MRFSIFYLVLILVLSFLSCKTTKTTLQLKPSWEENFDTFDTARWSRIPRGTSDWNRHMSYYDSCYDLKDGKLILRGLLNTTQVQDTSPYLTGGVYTKDKVVFGFGRLEIRAKLGEATGAWPAFWLLAQDRRYPQGGEIDIMEHLNFDTIAYQTVHSYYTITLNEKKNPPQGVTGKINRGEFNTYAVEKHKDSLVFFINNQRTFSYPRIKTDKKDQFPFSEGPHYLLLDMQLGGSWVGKVNDSDLPVEMEIDWVRFYSFDK